MAAFCKYRYFVCLRCARVTLSPSTTRAYRGSAEEVGFRRHCPAGGFSDGLDCLPPSTGLVAILFLHPAMARHSAAAPLRDACSRRALPLSDAHAAVRPASWQPLCKPPALAAAVSGVTGFCEPSSTLAHCPALHATRDGPGWGLRSAFVTRLHLSPSGTVAVDSSHSFMANFQQISDAPSSSRWARGRCREASGQAANGDPFRERLSEWACRDLWHSRGPWPLPPKQSSRKASWRAILTTTRAPDARHATPAPTPWPTTGKTRPEAR